VFNGVEIIKEAVGRGDSIPLVFMSAYHNTHWVTFYKQSVLSAPVSLAMNCFMFNALSCLSDDDANLFFYMGHCFVCHMV
jgi:hypothetical protein